MPSPALCLPLWSLIPFVLMLVSIAVLPMAVPEWWDSNRNKTILSVAFSVPVLVVVLACEPRLLLHSLLDYFSFLTLLGSLFVIVVRETTRGSRIRRYLTSAAGITIAATRRR